MNNKVIYQENIYTYHIDFVGHVNNCIYIQWMENGRTKLLEAIGLPVSHLAKNEGLVPIITQTNIVYKRPYFLENKANIETWVSKLNNASLVIEFRFYNEKDELCASGRQKALLIDHNSMRPMRLTDAHHKAIEKYYIPTSK